MGHSRGGEAVAVAGAFNRLPAYPDDATRRFNFNFDIRALVAIAPVDGQYKLAEQPTPLSDYNYLVIHGSHDGDVSSFNGLVQYNRVRYTKPSDQFKSAIWMYRANHGQWNTVWNNKDNGKFSARSMRLEALVSGEQQRQFGRVVISGFLEATLHGKAEFEGWYQRVIRIFFDEDHRVKSVTVDRQGEDYNLGVVVEWKASVWNPPAPYSARIMLDAYQRWVVRAHPVTGKPVVRTYIVDRLEYHEGSAKL